MDVAFAVRNLKDGNIGNMIRKNNLRKIPNYPNYAITPNGRIWSYNTNKWMKTHKKGNYHWIQLRVNKKPKYKSVHRLVAETYIPNPNNKRTVNHKDFNTNNNSINNLEWSTDRENVLYTYSHNRRPKQKEIARRNGRKTCKLSDKDIKNIRKLVQTKRVTITEIAKIYDVHRETISRVIREITYKHIV